jgi:hypothetical protein
MDYALSLPNSFHREEMSKKSEVHKKDEHCVWIQASWNPPRIEV